MTILKYFKSVCIYLLIANNMDIVSIFIADKHDKVKLVSVNFILWTKIKVKHIL